MAWTTSTPTSWNALRASGQTKRGWVRLPHKATRYQHSTVILELACAASWQLVLAGKQPFQHREVWGADELGIRQQAAMLQPQLCFKAQRPRPPAKVRDAVASYGMCGDAAMVLLCQQQVSKPPPTAVPACHQRATTHGASTVLCRQSRAL